jgi:hypothetical protein
MSKAYPSDLTPDQFDLISPLLPTAKSGGRPREVDLKAVCPLHLDCYLAGTTPTFYG